MPEKPPTLPASQDLGDHLAPTLTEPTAKKKASPKKKTKKKASPKKKAAPARGRPAGSKNRPVDEVAAVAARCPKCRSTDRGPYFRTTAATYAGIDSQGHEYTHIVRRWTTCKKCGQVRIDRFYENRAEKEPPAKKK